MEKAVFNLLDVVNWLSQKNFAPDELDQLVVETNQARADFEAELPATELDMKLHNLKHLAERVRIAGPPWCLSCFPYERLYGTFNKKLLYNTARPEASILTNVGHLIMAVCGVPQQLEDTGPGSFLGMEFLGGLQVGLGGAAGLLQRIPLGQPGGDAVEGDDLGEAAGGGAQGSA